MSDIVTIRNYEKKTELDEEGGKKKTFLEPRLPDEIILDILAHTNGWPKALGDVLFGPSEDQKKIMHWKSADSFEMWLFKKYNIKLEFRTPTKACPSLVTVAKIYNGLCHFVENYETVHALPHEPRQVKDYYLPSADIAPRETGYLSQLVDMFSPDSPQDRCLIEAFFTTPFWGGPRGARPVFVIDGPQNDPEGGRAVGKTTIVQTVGKLAGGVLAVEETKRRDIKEDIVNSDKMYRVLFMDNIKRSKFSSESLESLITIEDIQAKLMYLGIKTVPNYFTFSITFNEATMSKDMATRSVRIRLARPDEEKLIGWQERLDKLMDDHRQDIIADILYKLRSPAKELSRSKFRFPRWVNEVLMKSASPDIMKHITDSVSELDADKKLGEMIISMLHDKISSYSTGYGGCIDPEQDVVLVPSELFREWLVKSGFIEGNPFQIAPLLKQTCISCLYPFRGKRKEDSHYTGGYLWDPQTRHDWSRVFCLPTNSSRLPGGAITLYRRN